MGTDDKMATAAAPPAPAAAPTVFGEAGPVVNKHKKPPLFWKNPLSYLLFTWYSGLLRLGYRRTIQFDDLFDIPDPLYTAELLPGYDAEWVGQLARAEGAARAKAAARKGGKGGGGAAGAAAAGAGAAPPPGAGALAAVEAGREEEDPLKGAKEGEVAAPLTRTVWRRHRGRLLMALAMQMIYMALQFVGPNMLSQIVKYISQPEQLQTSYGLHKSYVFAVCMFVAPVLGSVVASQSNRISIGTQVMVRAELTAAIYRKALRLSTRVRQSTETGRIVNLMSADVNAIQMFFWPFAIQIVTGPCMLVAALVQLWFQIRWATFIGLGILLFTSPISGIFMKKITGYRRTMLQQTDKRVKLMNQLLVGIRVLKMYAWEAAQEAAVLEVRRAELRELGKAIPYRVALQSLLFAAPQIAMVVCFVVYGSAQPDDFTAANIFTAISLFSLMRYPLIFLPFALIVAGNALVSTRRLTAFLLLEERVPAAEAREEPGIEVVGGCFFWAEPPPKTEAPPGKKGGKKEWRGRRGGKGKQGGGAAPEEPAVNGAAHADGAAAAAASSKGGAVAVALPGMADGGQGKAGEGGGGAAGAKAAAADGKQADGSPKAAFTLHDINLSVKRDELVCVVGRVGSGKSSLVQAVLGEMERSAGAVRIGGRLAYAAQQAWIINGTVRDNVTFGLPFDEARWEAAVEACCLGADLEVLPAGADTEIGEKGINLSGGQKQRISLARALYQDAEVYVLDDPLSAVDVHVGRHIFDNFINGAVAGQARLLVTNQLQYLPAADHVVVLDEGRVVVQGSYEACQANKVFARLLREHNAVEEDAGPSPPGPSSEEGDLGASSAGEEGEAGGGAPAVDADEARIAARLEAEALGMQPGGGGRAGVEHARLSVAPTFRGSKPPPSSKSGGGDGGEGEARASPRPRRASADAGPRHRASADAGARRRASTDAGGRHGKQLAGFDTMVAAHRGGGGGKGGGGGAPARGALVIKEDQEVGQVAGKVYWAYIVAYSIFSFFLLLVLWGCEQAVRILTTWWLSNWTNAEMITQYTGVPTNRTYYVGSYVGFALGFVALSTLRSLSNLVSSLRASRVVHERSLTHLVRSPVSFFDTTPVGRVLNRFSKDTGDMDFLLTMSMSEFGNCVFQLIATLIFLAVIQPWILVGITPLCAVYYLLQRYYRRSNIELQRQDAVSRSPIFAHFSESLSGVETIRAYGMAQAFALSSDAKVDANHRAYFSARMANEWLSVRLDFLGACVVLLAAILAIVNRNTIDAALAAMTLSEALDVTLFLKSAVTSGAMFETRFNSVERLTAYWELPQEAPAASAPGAAPPDEWPDEGRLEYRGVWMRYRPELDPVLKGVSFVVQPGDKVGIAGRTGSGKSSLIVTLFRLVEPYAGEIVLDGRNTLGLGLDDVRGRIAAIPQDPVLFSGTVRSNLDPYSRHTDAELWDVLGHVALKDLVAALPEGLSARVAENGDNFSVGQRQLLCVGRALLRQPRVLVADEATASVDSETDGLIQRTIRREFRACTVLTIAHRINTILDSTKVLVMVDGVVGEYDTVPALMGRTRSTFRRMVVEAGLESSAAAIGRAASAASLAAAAAAPAEAPAEGQGAAPAAEAAPAGRGTQRREGLQTFVRRMKADHDLRDD